MAVIRVERTKDYTIMANHHLRNKKLSMKAKGLMSVLLSLPDEWHYSISGLTQICKEGADAIRAAIRELQKCDYVTRSRVRNKTAAERCAESLNGSFIVFYTAIIYNLS